jgi:hypothetical protein
VSTPPSVHNPEVSPALDAAVLKGCALEPAARFQTAIELADALEHTGPSASGRTVGRFVESMAAEGIALRRRMVAEAESAKSGVGVLSQELTRPSSPVEPSRPDGTRLGGVSLRRASSRHRCRRQRRRDPRKGQARRRPGPARPRRLSAPLVGVIAGLLLATAIGVIALIVRLAGGHEPSDPAMVKAIEPPVVEVAPSEPLQPSATDAAIEPPPPPVEATPIRPKRVGTTPRPPTTTAKPAPQPPTTATPPTKESCWYIDSDGETRFRKGCKWK